MFFVALFVFSGNVFAGTLNITVNCGICPSNTCNITPTITILKNGAVTHTLPITSRGTTSSTQGKFTVTNLNGTYTIIGNAVTDFSQANSISHESVPTITFTRSFTATASSNITFTYHAKHSAATTVKLKSSTGAVIPSALIKYYDKASNTLLSETTATNIQTNAYTALPKFISSTKYFPTGTGTAVKMDITFNNKTITYYPPIYSNCADSAICTTCYKLGDLAYLLAIK